MNSFETKSVLTVNEEQFTFYSLKKITERYPQVKRLPFCIKVLLENMLRFEDGKQVSKKMIESVINWETTSLQSEEVSFRPARVILQDFTGVPAIVDLAAMRDAVKKLAGEVHSINPLCPVELVIDHSVMVDSFGHPLAVNENVDLDYSRNKERYQFLKWGQQAFENFKVVPPNTGIVHQVNLEYLARVVFEKETHCNELPTLYPDTLVGTDSHTTMINALGVLGWGVGGIEAEACMLGQPVSLLLPQVVGFEFTGALAEGVTSTDLVLEVVAMLREKGVVGQFVEFFGAGLQNLTLADRATIANMAPEYGATCGFFPVDEQTMSFLTLTSRSERQRAIIEHYCQEQELFYTTDQKIVYSSVISLNLDKVSPCISGPKRPQDKILLSDAKKSFQEVLGSLTEDKKLLAHPAQQGKTGQLSQGFVAIAAITSCTNTSNPSVMIAAGLLAKKACDYGLKVPSWVKTSLAPGSQVVTAYLNQTGLTDSLEQLGFHTVGYGCTTCIGNSGPLDPEIAQAIEKENLLATAVLSGNRNFEGRIHPQVRAAYLASPPLVVAYALAGTMNIDLTKDPVGLTSQGQSVYLKDLWPTSSEIQEIEAQALSTHLFQKHYAQIFSGDKRWEDIEVTSSAVFSWQEKSTYIKNPPYFQNFSQEPEKIQEIVNARCLALLGDSITTDHISPAGMILEDSPAGQYLLDNGVKKEHFNSYGARRGHDEVMIRGTFANVRLRNQLTPEKEGGWTYHFPTGQTMTIYEAAIQYRSTQTPLIILAGQEYGTGSSRDWAAKGTKLLGVKAVIAQSYERIHRSNLIGMGVLPLEFLENQSATSLGLTGAETFTINLHTIEEPLCVISIQALLQSGQTKEFSVRVRIDTPKELEYFTHGGILPYMIRKMMKEESLAKGVESEVTY